MGRLVRRGRAFNCVNVLFTLAFGYWLIAHRSLLYTGVGHFQPFHDGFHWQHFAGLNACHGL